MNEVFRQEKKYWLTQIDMQILSGRLEKVMLQDPHNGAQGYTIRSLYFDTLGETDYQGKIDGLEVRRKIRLRAYDPAAAFAMLEMKQKEGNYQKKRSLRLERADAQAVARGSTTPCCGMRIPSRQSAMACCMGSATGPKPLWNTGARPSSPGKTRSASPWITRSGPRRAAGISFPPSSTCIR